MMRLVPMNNCPFLDSVKSVLTAGKCNSEGCPLGKIPPIGHLIIAGSLVLVLTVLIGAMVSRPQRD